MPGKFDDLIALYGEDVLPIVLTPDQYDEYKREKESEEVEATPAAQVTIDEHQAPPPDIDPMFAPVETGYPLDLIGQAPSDAESKEEELSAQESYRRLKAKLDEQTSPVKESEDGFLGMMGDSFGGGVDMMQGLMQYAGAVGADYLGAEETRKEWMADAKENFDASSANRQKHDVPNLFTDPDADGNREFNLDSWGKAGTYLTYTLGEQLPMLIPGLLTGGAGIAVGTAGKAAVVNAVQSGVKASLAKRAAASLATTKGVAAASFAGSYPMAVGELVSDVLEETGNFEPDIAAAGGVLIAALDTVLPATILKKVFPGIEREIAEEVTEKLVKTGFLETLKQAGASVGKAGLIEFGTEGAQKAVSEAFVSALSERKDFFSNETVYNVLEEAVAGGLVGGAMGGATGLMPTARSDKRLSKKGQESEQRGRDQINAGMEAGESTEDVTAPPVFESGLHVNYIDDAGTSHDGKVISVSNDGRQVEVKGVDGDTFFSSPEYISRSDNLDKPIPGMEDVGVDQMGNPMFIIKEEHGAKGARYPGENPREKKGYSQFFQDEKPTPVTPAKVTLDPEKEEAFAQAETEAARQKVEDEDKGQVTKDVTAEIKGTPDTAMGLALDAAKKQLKASTREEPAGLEAAVEKAVEQETTGTEESPIPVETEADMEVVRSKTKVKPTQKQKTSGDYPKGHADIAGHTIAIESPKGTVREGKDEDGTNWSAELAADYGEVPGTLSSDGDAVDVFVGPKHKSSTSFVIDQVDPETGAHDEPKIMVGFNSMGQARQSYIDSFSDGKGEARIGSMTQTPLANAMKWAQTGAPAAGEAFTQSRLSKKGTDVTKKARISREEAATSDQRVEFEKATGLPAKFSVTPKEEIQYSTTPKKDVGHNMDVARGTRTIEQAKLTKAEVKKVTPAANAANLNPQDVLDEVSRLKGKFPTSEGWAPMQFTKVTKKDFPSKRELPFSVDFKVIPYSFHQSKPARAVSTTKTRGGKTSNKTKTQIKKDQTAANKRAVIRHETMVVEKMVSEFRVLQERAATGDKAAQVMMRQSKWYSNMRTRLRQSFGSAGDLFADLLGATSPNTPVATNWKFAVEVLELASEGKFDTSIQNMALWADHLRDIEQQRDLYVDQQQTQGRTKSAIKEDTEYKRLNRKPEIPFGLPRQKNGKLFGMNSTNALVALTDMWRVITAGSAPKARNFSGNLIGYTTEATIDVWAARFLQRMANKPRIPSPAEGGVKGDHGAGSTKDVPNIGGAFGFGQRVFRKAADQLNVNPDDLQAMVWFAEKELWTKKDWTTKMGEGGSFEQEMDATPTERLIGMLSKAQSAEMQGVDYTPTDADQAATGRLLEGSMLEGGQVVSASAMSTLGRYGGDERSFDIEVVARKGYNPASLWNQMLEVAKGSDQDSMGLSRVVEGDIDYTKHRPGMELYFRDAADIASLEPVLKEMTSMGVEYFTFAVDPKRLPRSLSGKMPPSVGLRILHVPEYTDSVQWLQKASDSEVEGHIRKARLELRRVAKKVRSLAEVSYSNVLFYETRITFREDYNDDTITSEKGRVGGRAGGSRTWAGRTVSDGAAAANRIFRSRRGRGDDSGPVPGAQQTSTTPDAGGSRRTGSYSGKRQRRGAREVFGVHYSNQERNQLDSSAYGTGMEGSEFERLQGADPRLSQRVYFYVNTGAGITPESDVGATPHGVSLTNLYNTSVDAGNIWNWRNFPGLHGGELANAQELAIVEAGYDGYYNPTAQGSQGVAVLLDRQSVPVVSLTPAQVKTAPAARSADTTIGQKIQEALDATSLPTGASKPSRWLENTTSIQATFPQLTSMLKAHIEMGDSPIYRSDIGALVDQSMKARYSVSPASPAPAANFYSALTEGVDMIPQKKAPVSQWKAMIKKLSQKGVKPAEIAWSGVDTWLDEQTGPVLKEGLMGYLRSQEVVLQEVVNYAPEEDNGPFKLWAEYDPYDDYTLDRIKDGQIETIEEGGVNFELLDDDFDSYEDVTRYARKMLKGDNGLMTDADDNVIHEGDVWEDVVVQGGVTKYQEYQMGGDSTGYKEILLTLPIKTVTTTEINKSEWVSVQGSPVMTFDPLEGGVETGGRIYYRVDGRGNWDTIEFPTREEAESQLSESPTREVTREVETYKSGHWDETNVAMHIRFNERVVNGKRVLFMEENQDDWAQAGRMYGFAGTETETTLSPPDRPFKNTATWAMIGFKRMIRYAAENNFDQISWTPGEVQNERYDLSKKVSLISYNPGSQMVTARGLNGENVLTKKAAPAELPGIIGKDATDKLLASALMDNGWHALQGEDLRLAGKGMIGFYDKILPKEVGEFVKKFDTKVVVSKVPVAKGEPTSYANFEEWKTAPELKDQDVWTVNVTPKMKAAALDKGMPLFSATNGQDKSGIFTQQFRKQYDELRKEIHLIAQSLTDKRMSVRTPDQIVIDNQVAAEASGNVAATTAGGMYDPVSGIISVALKDEAYNPFDSVFHETFHWLEDHGFFTQEETSWMNENIETLRMAAAEAFGLSASDPQIQAMSDSEVRAVAFAAYATERMAMERGGRIMRALPPVIRRAFTRLRNFFMKVGHSVRRFGFEKGSDVFSTTYEGSVGRRQVSGRSESLNDPMASLSGQFATRPSAGDIDTTESLAEGNDPFHNPRWWNKTPAFLKGLGSSFRYYAQNQFDPWARYQDAAMAKTGVLLEEDEDVVLVHKLYAGNVGSEMGVLGKLQDHLIDLIKSSGVDINEVNHFLQMLHARERNEHIAEINDNFQNIPPDEPGGSGWSENDILDEEAGHAARSPEEQAVLAEISSTVQEIRRFDLDTRLAHGLLSEQQHSSLLESYKNYVPLMGWELPDPELDQQHEVAAHEIKRRKMAKGGSGKGFNVANREYKRAAGRKTRAANVMGNLISMSTDGVIRGNKNEIGQSVLRMIKTIQESDPSDKTFQVQPRKQIPVFNTITGQVSYRNVIQLDSEETQRSITFKVEGKDVTVLVSPEQARLAAAMNNLDMAQLPGILRATQQINRWLSWANTNANPEFAITNFLRDFIGAQFNISQYEQKELGKKVRNDILALRNGIASGVFRELRKKSLSDDSKTAHWQKVYQRYVKAGGKIYFHNWGGAEDVTKSLQNKIDLAMGTASTTKKMKHMGREVLQMIEDMNLTVDAVTRLAVFKNMTEMVDGDGSRVFSDARAAAASRDATVDFNERGAWGPVINSLFVFYNAGIQGSTVIYNAAKRSKRVRWALGGIVLAGFLSDQMNNWMDPDDEDEESLYNKMLQNKSNDWTMGHNMMFFLPGATEPVKIPMPYGYNAFYNMGMRISAMLRGKNSLGRVSVNVLDTSLNSFSPIDMGGGIPVPSAIEPFWDVAKNETWFGGKIYPDMPGDSRPESQKFYNATLLSREVTRVLNAIGKGDMEGHIKGPIDISPASVDYVVKSFAGGVGRTTGDLFEGVELLLGKRPPDQREPNIAQDIPYLRKIYGTKESNVDRSLYYSRMDSLEQRFARYDGLMESDEASARMKLDAEMEAYGPFHGRRETFKDITKAYKKVRKEWKRLRNNDEIEDSEKKPIFIEMRGDLEEILRDYHKVYFEADQETQANVATERTTQSLVARNRATDSLRRGDIDTAVALLQGAGAGLDMHDMVKATREGGYESVASILENSPGWAGFHLLERSRNVWA